jgi:ABC-type uncharacterized transport system involved in gliding motility auxiliary subunit
MKKQSLETLLYSTAGVAAMAGILIAFNVIAGTMKQRVDLTHEKAYSLSAGTKTILKQLQSPIKIRFYCTQGETSPETVYLRSYAKRVDDLLTEYQQVAGNKLVIEHYDPQPDSDAEESANKAGVEGQMLRDGERFYLGLSVSRLDTSEAIPFLDPGRERLLEYDLSRAITRVNSPDKPAVGVMSAVNLFGMPSNPMMARMGQQGQQPWIIINELKQDFTVKSVPMDSDKIDDDIRVLVVIHPRGITEKTQFAIDQFIMRGGKLIAFLDPVPMLIDKQQQQMMSMPNTGSSLDILLKAWGLSFDTTKAVADMRYKMQIGGSDGRPQEAPAVLSITADGINNDDIATSQLNNLWVACAGAFTGTPIASLKETVLLKSTKDSQLVEGFMASFPGDNVMKEFKASGVQYALAVRLTGKFPTAFPAGPPEEKKDDPNKPDTEKKADEKKPDTWLKETKEDNSVVLVGDADMLGDQVAFQPVQTLFGPSVYMPRNNNAGFLQNVVEQLTGDNNLIAVRSRANVVHPFTRIKDMETVANQKFQGEIKSLEQKKAEAQKKINELQAQRKDNQRIFLNKEQSAEIAKLRAEEIETGKHLKQVQKDFRKEVVSLQTKVKWINILAVPLAVAASGIALAIVKRKKTSAK